MGQIPPERSATSAGPGTRVLHVIPTALGRGAQVFARALVDELGGPDGGHTLVSLFDGETGVRVDRSLALPGGLAAASGLHPPALANLARVLRDLRPDLVLAHGGDAFKYLALTTRSPIAYCVIGTWPAAARRSSQNLLWRTLIRRAWVCAAVSDDVGADLHQVLAVPHERIVVIPNGRDAERYQPPADTARWRTGLAPLRGRLHRGQAARSLCRTRTPSSQGGTAGLRHHGGRWTMADQARARGPISGYRAGWVPRRRGRLPPECRPPRLSERTRWRRHARGTH